MVGIMVCFVLMAGLLFFVGFLQSGFELQACLVGGTWFASDFCVSVDLLSSAFAFMLLCCGFGALWFCGHYFSGFASCVGLFYLMLVFLGIMLLLVLSGSLVLTLVVWEYLGFVSFILILYYSNMASLRASIITLVSSRFGDIGLFAAYYYFWGDASFVGWGAGVCVLLVVITKSACYPFVSWLLEAMRAPTPVSSLVHSSTLVAAGAWFLLRYSNIFCGVSVWLLFLLSSVTVVLSGLCACFTVDIKKVVAFSTCNNISWCLLYYVSGDMLLSICQLLVHGVCKSLLFISVGDLMVSCGGSQSGVGVRSLVQVSWFSCFLNSVLLCCLCGLPFLGVFVVKHVFLGCSLFCYSYFYYCFVLFGLFLSCAYCFRFLAVFYNDCGVLPVGYFSCFFLSACLVCLSFGVDLVLFGVAEDVVLLGGYWQCLFLIIQAIGCIVGWCLPRLGVGSSVSCGVSDVFGCDYLVFWLYSVYYGVKGLLCLFLFRWEALVAKYFLLVEAVDVCKLGGLMLSVAWIAQGAGLVVCLWYVLM